MDNTFLGKDGFIWWKGVVEDRRDPIFLGRVRVRIFGWHTEDKGEMPTENLPWALVSQIPDNGRNHVGLKEGDWVWGFFLDGDDGQKPMIVGFIPGIDVDAADPEKGFSDPTTDLTPGSVPRPPDMAPTQDNGSSEEPGETTGGRFNNPDAVPGTNTAFGELQKDFSMRTTKFDANKDGTYNDEDAQKIIEEGKKDGEFFDGFTNSVSSFPMSRYPLENRLGEPTTSRLARNEKIEETVVELKNKSLGTGLGAGHAATSDGASSASFPFMEPKSPYAAVYPYNHVYESESGHVIEIDDTPGAERLHWFHRSGSFTEMHPDGTEVNKIKKQQYNFIESDFFLASGKTINVDSGDAMRFKSGNDMNRAVGGNLNAEVSNNYHLSTGAGVYVYSKGGVIFIKAVGDISLESTAGKIELKAPEQIVLSSANVYLQGEGGGETTVHMVSSDIRARELFAHKAGLLGRTPNAPDVAESVSNDADEKTDSESSSGPKPGFLLSKGSSGEVWKPISDSDGNLVTLSPVVAPHILYEALPTGSLEAAIIKYENEDGSITEWNVIRPAHALGEVIDRCEPGELFEDGVRTLFRWPKPGGQYPTQLFWQSGSATNLILDSAVRHMVKSPFNEATPYTPVDVPEVMIERAVVDQAIDSLTPGPPAAELPGPETPATGGDNATAMSASRGSITRRRNNQISQRNLRAGVMPFATSADAGDAEPSEDDVSFEEIKSKLKQIVSTVFKGRLAIGIAVAIKGFQKAIKELEELGDEFSKKVKEALEQLAGIVGITL